MRSSRKCITPFLFKEIKLKNSIISIVDQPVRAIRIERRDGTYFLPIKEFLEGKKFLEGLSKEEKKVLTILKNTLQNYVI
ncbi:hypothetical protein [Aquifex aeolicus]|uniref:hypothetical protein n=1 Tax=Aquifex aeolicus TaxID=63363 RepID=UPI0002FABBDC|nr:hypothetical protein [Aquifex aeolicus]